MEIRLYKPLEGNKEYTGVLKSFDGSNIMVTGEDGERTFARNDIAVIRLALDF